MTGRSVAILALATITLLTGCRVLAPGASGSPVLAETSPSPVVIVSPPGEPMHDLATPMPEASECSLGTAIAEHQYAGLRDLARFSDGVSVAEVVSVSELRYSTESGERPSCEYLEEAQSVFGVGRMVELRIITPVAGAAREGRTVQYMFPGGTLGADTSAGHHFGLQPPTVGDRMLVLVMDPPIDVDAGEGVLEVNVLELFAVTDSGRIVTPDRAENVTLGGVRELLRGVVPPASPGQ